MTCIKNKKINLDNIINSNAVPNQISNNKKNENDIDRENRLSSVITLHSKGLTQSEIAEQLQVDQSTISRDLQIIKDEARYNIEKYTKEEIPFEYFRYKTGIDKIISKLWNLIEIENVDPSIKFKIQGLSLLKQCYDKRIEVLIGGSNSEMNAKKHMEKILHQEKMENDPLVKALRSKYY